MANGLEKILEVKNLTTSFFTSEGQVKAVDDVSFDVYRGKTLGIVGESGCGKSVTSLSIMRLIPNPPGKITGGQILYKGRDLLTLDAEANKINVEVSAEEFARRRKAWTAPPFKAARGTLYKYIKSVKSASEGCVTDE